MRSTIQTMSQQELVEEDSFKPILHELHLKGGFEAIRHKLLYLAFGRIMLELLSFLIRQIGIELMLMYLYIKKILITFLDEFMKK